MSAPLAPAPVPAGDLTSAASPAATDPRRSPLRLTVVRTPGPPAVQPRGPVALVVPGRYPDRQAPPPGPRPRMDAPAQFPGVDPEFGPRHTRRTELPEATGAGRRLVTLALEAFAGRRPIAQLRPVVTPALFAALSSGRRPRWCAEGTAALAVTSVRVCEPVDGVAEVSAVVRRSGRAHAVAARLEGIDGRWRCTALQVG
ncbi:Rv3235 family protein [Modestobacter sp. URMC 112]